MAGVQFGVLGPLEVVSGGVRVRLGGAQRVRLLAVLLLEADRVVPLARLIDALWDKQPPTTAKTQVHKTVSRLRQLLGVQMLVGDPAGYRLHLGDDVELDVRVFAEHAARADRAAEQGRLADAVVAARAGLRLWRGPALAGVSGSVVRAAAQRLDEQRITVLERCLHWELELGQHAQAVAELTELVSQHPLRERFRGLLMLALYQAGRQADALKVYEHGRRILAEELGLDPGPELRAVHQQVLAGVDEVGPMSGRRGDSASAFAEELEGLLKKRRMSWRKLSDLAGYTPGWLSKVKHGAPPSAELARRVDQVLEAGGRLIALAAVASPARLAQLPAAAATFVGREAELRELIEVLALPGLPGTPHMVAIDGPPGVGKTALALRLAHGVASRYTDGQLYVDLRAYSPDGRPRLAEEVLEEFLIALGVQVDVIPAGLESRSALYRSVLADRQVLVVLDNAADSHQLQPLVPAFAGCAVVVTSRKRLGGISICGDQRVSLGPMSEEESITLLRKVISAERAGAELDAVRALAERCGRLPLALRIAGERVVMHPHYSVGQLVDELAYEEQRLDALITDDSAAVRTVFSWSYRNLSTDGARMFRLVGLHAGAHVSTGAAAALAGMPIHNARRLLDRLSNVHLLEGLGGDRYRMHDLLRVYAAEQAMIVDPPVVRTLAIRRMIDWYLHNAYAANYVLAPQRSDPELDDSAFDVDIAEFDYETALQWCEIEMENIAMATQMAVDVGENIAAWKMPVGCFNYLYLRKRWTQWVASHELGVIGARRARDRFGEAWVRNNLAIAYRELRRLDEARSCYLKALTIRRKIGDQVGEAWTLTGIGFLDMEMGAAEDAARHFEQALDIFQETGGNRDGDAISLANVGDAYRALRRYNLALDALRAGLEVFRDLAAQWGESYTLVKLGDTYCELEQPDDALSCFQQALETRRQSGDRWGEGETLHKRGQVLLGTGQIGPARESLSRALEIFEELGDPRAADVRACMSSLNPVSIKAEMDPPSRLRQARPSWP